MTTLELVEVWDFMTINALGIFKIDNLEFMTAPGQAKSVE